MRCAAAIRARPRAPSAGRSTTCSRAWATWPSRCASAGPGNGQDIAEIEERERRSEDRDPLGRSDGNYGDAVDTGVDKVPLELERQRSREILDELRRRAGEQRPKDELDYIDRLLKTY